MKFLRWSMKLFRVSDPGYDRDLLFNDEGRLYRWFLQLVRWVIHKLPCERFPYIRSKLAFRIYVYLVRKEQAKAGFQFARPNPHWFYTKAIRLMNVLGFEDERERRP